MRVQPIGYLREEVLPSESPLWNNQRENSFGAFQSKSCRMKIIKAVFHDEQVFFFNLHVHTFSYIHEILHFTCSQRCWTSLYMLNYFQTLFWSSRLFTGLKWNIAHVTWKWKHLVNLCSLSVCVRRFSSLATPSLQFFGEVATSDSICYFGSYWLSLDVTE